MASPFDGILEVVKTYLRPDPSILDAGAGGFCGTKTTDPLLAAFPDYSQLVAIERNKERAEALRAKYGESVEVIEADYFNLPEMGRFDVVVLDLDIQYFPKQFDSTLNTTADVTATGGFVIFRLPVNLLPVNLPALEKQYAAARDGQLDSFMDRVFGKDVLTEQDVADVFVNSPFWFYVGVTDETVNGLRWVVARRMKRRHS